MLLVVVHDRGRGRKIAESQEDATRKHVAREMYPRAGGRVAGKEGRRDGGG